MGREVDQCDSRTMYDTMEWARTRRRQTLSMPYPELLASLARCGGVEGSSVREPSRSNLLI